MKTLVDSNEYPNTSYHFRSIPNAEDIERIDKDMRQIVQGDNWGENGSNHIRQKYIRLIDRGLGIGLLWLYADEHEKSKGSSLHCEEFFDIVHPTGVSKSYAFECKRAAYVVMKMLNEPKIWRTFSKEFLHNTAICRLSYMKPSLEKYLQSKKTNADWKKLLEVMKRSHTLNRLELLGNSERRKIHKLKGKIKEVQGKELVITIPGTSSLAGQQNNVIGSSAKVFVTVYKNNRSKKESGSDESDNTQAEDSIPDHSPGPRKKDRSSKFSSMLSEAVAWLVGRIKVILHLAH